MDNYYLAAGIIKYFDPTEYLQASKVSTQWRKAAYDLIYSLSCYQCGISRTKIWRKFNFTKPNNFDLLCFDCSIQIEKIKDIKDINFNQYAPAIPLEPGDSQNFWVTSDLPQDWLNLWICFK